MGKEAAASLNPAQVESALTQLAEAWPDDATPIRKVIESFPLGEAALLHLLAMSRISVARLVRNPDLLLWLARPEICLSPRGYPQMLAELDHSSADPISTNNFRPLRLWKNREMTRIALRELADVASLEETTAELSYLAEICVDRVYRHWRSKLSETISEPRAELAIIALGKLGGRELNHSSDIDVLFLYSDEGQVSARITNHEWFNRLSEKILTAFSTPDPEGALFRVDVRLRPEGSAGPLARSLESMENYYAGFGETWERLALIKARRIAGSRELAYEFLRQHQPFIYPKSPTPDVLDEIARIKRRIEREVVGIDNLGRNVKLGRGGIREIEFVVQTLQFIHGARHAFLQETSTLKGLIALATLELIPKKAVLDLDRSYRFLRRTEHRLQIDAEQQTHTVPREAELNDRLARSLGFGSGVEFTAALQQSMQAVHAIFETVITTSAAESVTLDLAVFRDQKAAARGLNDLTRKTGHSHVGPRTQQLFRKLQPLLLAQLARTSDPDATLNQFVRFVEAYALRGVLFESLVANPKLMELLIRTLDASRFAGDFLIRQPQVLEDMTRRDETFYRPRTLDDHLRRLHELGASPTNLDPVRAYRHRQVLRIILRELLDAKNFETLFTELSDLAEACLVFVNRLLGGDELTIIALGKFGGREINYGADLDVIFLGEDVRAAQNLIVALSQSTAEGSIAALDARLRPDGEKGPLVCSLATYESYYRQRAQLWEIQALSRARPISGRLQQEYIAIAQNSWREAGQRSDLIEKINTMADRVRRDRGSGSDFADFKTGRGGMVEAEFALQALQMKHKLWSASWDTALPKLIEQNVVSAPEGEGLARSYNFLRRCETALRRWQNSKVDVIPGDQDQQRKFTARLGYKNADSFEKDYRAAREGIHQFYTRHMQSSVT
jgi:glutamate-ammonia-ligase adenylyltransferase